MIILNNLATIEILKYWQNLIKVNIYLLRISKCYIYFAPHTRLTHSTFLTLYVTPSHNLFGTGSSVNE
jgi:hypothetical protein